MLSFNYFPNINKLDFDCLVLRCLVYRFMLVVFTNTFYHPVYVYLIARVSTSISCFSFSLHSRSLMKHSAVLVSIKHHLSICTLASAAGHIMPQILKRMVNNLRDAIRKNDLKKQRLEHMTWPYRNNIKEYFLCICLQCMHFACHVFLAGCFLKKVCSVILVKKSLQDYFS